MVEDPSALWLNVNPRNRWWSSSVARVPSGSITARACNPIRATWSGEVMWAWSTRNRSNPSACSPFAAAGILCTVEVMARACDTEISPAAWAAATTGYSGGMAPPVKSTRGPSSFAARTRDAASPGESRKACTSTVAVLGHPTSAYTPEETRAATRP
jgi:hypothetical protein